MLTLARVDFMASSRLSASFSSSGLISSLGGGFASSSVSSRDLWLLLCRLLRSPSDVYIVINVYPNDMQFIVWVCFIIKFKFVTVSELPPTSESSSRTD